MSVVFAANFQLLARKPFVHAAQDQTQKNDKDTVLLRKLNTLIHTDERVEEVLLPIRDGLMIARKK